MEELLNKLIEKGWKPFELSYRGSYDFEFKDNGHTLVSCHSNEDDEYTSFDRYSWRDLVSKESGLWQFVCENGMIKKNSNDDKYNSWQKNMYNSYLKRYRAYAKYRLIESALCNEEDLEKFLLDNIEIDGE